MAKEIAVIVPAWNEAECIEENILALDGFLGSNFSSHEIIISEDGSTDGTDRIAGSLSARSSNIIHLHSDARLGKGKAMTNAILASGAKNIFLMDADFPAGLSCIPRMTGLLEGSELVLGSRFKKGSAAERSLMRAFASISYNVLVRLLFRTGVRDHQCGVKAMRSSLKDVVLEMRKSGFFWDTELIVKARQRGLRITEVPIAWRERRVGASKISVFKEAYRMGKDAITLWYKLNWMKQPFPSA